MHLDSVYVLRDEIVVANYRTGPRGR